MFTNTIASQAETLHPSHPLSGIPTSNLPVTFIRNYGNGKIPSIYYSQGAKYAVHFKQSEVFFVFIKPASKRSHMGPNARKEEDSQQFELTQPLAEDANGLQTHVNDSNKNMGLVLALRFIDANPSVLVEAENVSSTKINFFHGNNSDDWHTGILVYQEIKYRELWPGVNMVFKGNDGQVKYELYVKPGADVNSIRLSYEGADNIILDNDGNLLIESAFGTVTDTAPICFQFIDGKQKEVKCNYILEQTENGDSVYGFRMSEDYDPSYSLLIDPGLDYSSYLGGTDDDQGHAITVDDAGNAYITGRTFSDDFPTTAGVFQPIKNGGYDAFITKVNPTASQILWSTFLGGTSVDWAYDIAIDSEYNVYVAGVTDSDDFPVTPGTIGDRSGVRNMFLTKLSATGDSLIYSCYGGGDGDDYIYGLAVDSVGNAYVTGETTSTDLPIPLTAPQPTLGGISDGFIFKVNSTATAIIYGTYLGGSEMDHGTSIAIDADLNAYVCGITGSSDFPVTGGAFQTTFGGEHDGFVTKINADATAWVYSTFLGGTHHDDSYAIELDSDGYAYVAGRTNSDDFPTTPGVYQPSRANYYDCTITKLNQDGTDLEWSTFFGGSGGDESAKGIALDPDGNVIITGHTNSPDLPVTYNAIQNTYAGDTDVILAKFNPTASTLIYSTFLGADGQEEGSSLAVDLNGNAYITGYTLSDEFPVTAGVFQPTYAGFIGFADAFVVKFDFERWGGGYRLVRYVINTTDDFPEDAQQLDADFFLIPEERKVIHGTVRFPDGAVAPAAVVKFFKMLNPTDDPETTCDLESIGHAITDDCGQFLLGPLPPDVNVIIKIFYLKNASVMGTPVPYIGTATPIDP